MDLTILTSFFCFVLQAKSVGNGRMKFNERELAAWASTFVPDKEGLLEKRGAGISHGDVISLVITATWIQIQIPA